MNDTAPRQRSERKDAMATRSALVDAVGAFAELHGRPPERLSDIARLAGVSTATAYRHFADAEDVTRHWVQRLPSEAIARFERASARSPIDEPAIERLHRWNREWVRSCARFGGAAVSLRSTAGFLARRAAGDPVVVLVCTAVEPLLAPFTSPTRNLVGVLTVWNAVSDPREVLDLRATHRWSLERISRFITDVVAGDTATSR